MLTLPNAIVSILIPFATLFTNPTWRKAQVLLVGAILTPGQRTVAAALRVMGRSDHRDYARYHADTNPHSPSDQLKPNLCPCRHLLPKPTATRTTEPNARATPKRAHLTPAERKERGRVRDADNRRRLKALALCKDSRRTAIPCQARRNGKRLGGTTALDYRACG